VCCVAEKGANDKRWENCALHSVCASVLVWIVESVVRFASNVRFPHFPTMSLFFLFIFTLHLILCCEIGLICANLIHRLAVSVHSLYTKEANGQPILKQVEDRYAIGILQLC
jgi:hypothetical protein